MVSRLWQLVRPQSGTKRHMNRSSSRSQAWLRLGSKKAESATSSSTPQLRLRMFIRFCKHFASKCTATLPVYCYCKMQWGDASVQTLQFCQWVEIYTENVLVLKHPKTILITISMMLSSIYIIYIYIYHIASLHPITSSMCKHVLNQTLWRALPPPLSENLHHSCLDTLHLGLNTCGHSCSMM